MVSLAELIKREFLNPLFQHEPVVHHNRELKILRQKIVSVRLRNFSVLNPIWFSSTNYHNYRGAKYGGTMLEIEKINIRCMHALIFRKT